MILDVPEAAVIGDELVEQCWPSDGELTDLCALVALVWGWDTRRAAAAVANFVRYTKRNYDARDDPRLWPRPSRAEVWPGATDALCAHLVYLAAGKHDADLRVMNATKFRRWAMDARRAAVADLWVLPEPTS